MMNIVFAAILYFSCAMIVYKLKRRKRFWLRLSLCTVTYFLFIILWTVFDLKLKVGGFNFIFPILAAMCLAMMVICFKTKIANSLFYLSVAYTIEHVSNGIYRLLMLAFGFGNTWRALVQAACGVLTMVIIYFLFVKKVERKNADGSFLLPKTTTIIISIIAFLFIYVLSSYVDKLRHDYGTLLYIYDFGSGLLLLLVQFGLFSRSKIEEEKRLVSYAMAVEHKQHVLSKENIEQINIKCHDLKHQIALLLDNKNSILHDEQLKELENIVKIYEAEFRTGNSTLDVVLTEKSLYCSKFNVKILSVIDGDAISKLKEEDIYSLFGNILDNAIECLVQIEDEAAREMDLKIMRKGNITVIHEENYCPEPLQFKNGLPQTTKRDSVNHGYGMASIKYIVKKYNGTLTVKQEDSRFILNIIIPD